MITGRTSRKSMLKFIVILRKALRVSVKNGSFIIVSLLSSLPLLCFSVLYFEPLLAQVLLQTLQILGPETRVFPNKDLPFPLSLTRNIDLRYSYGLMRLGVLWLVQSHLLESYPIIAVVHASSKLYAGESFLTLIELIQVPNLLSKLRRVLSMRFYITFFSVCFLVGAIWLTAVYYVIVRLLSGNYIAYAVMALYRAGCVGLLSKWLEISAVMNTSMVISTLDETHGAESLMLSAHLTGGGNDQTDFHLSAVFFILAAISRLFCHRARCSDRLVHAVFQLCLMHFVNVMQWVSFTVSLCRCKALVKHRTDEAVDSDCESGKSGK